MILLWNNYSFRTPTSKVHSSKSLPYLQKLHHILCHCKSNICNYTLACNSLPKVCSHDTCMQGTANSTIEEVKGCPWESKLSNPTSHSSRRAAWVPLSAVQHCASSCSNGKAKYAWTPTQWRRRLVRWSWASPSLGSSIPRRVTHVPPILKIPIPGDCSIARRRRGGAGYLNNHNNWDCWNEWFYHS